ncbi:hypothetical protein N0V93_001986 [Gnomoniopsis smithogilvyi]|uniref:RNase III domain-containing protein n=1 Tax=Gnomoniopsis smithogilvyi TaxID=1191159 RepID=A0A9W8Z4W7_9PEZI|nr:hypothetical protein N0V93_001986 [Gnomoniopsis smithogilvyi]
MASRTPPSVIHKLAKCQKILGYEFRDISLLEQSLTLKRNRRLATAGDTYLQVALVDRWFSLASSTPYDFNVIRAEAVSNSTLSALGFRRGLHLCTLPHECTTFRQMADTVEAIVGAVYRDALFENGKRNPVEWDEFEGVVARLGINHPLIATSADIRWSLTPIRTSRKLLPQFFSKGNHLELTKMLAMASGKS